MDLASYYCLSGIGTCVSRVYLVPFRLGYLNMAKEMYKGDISYQADIYALGVTMLEVWFGDIWPHQTDRYDKNRRYVLDYLSLLEDDHPQLYQLIKQCVSVKREKRPSIEMVVDTLTTMVTL